MTDLDRAKALLRTGGHTCVLCRGRAQYVSDLRGVAPLLGWIDQSLDLRGFSAADKVVGKATALLYILLGVQSLHAGVISHKAAVALDRHGLPYTWDKRVPGIINRAGDGPCPMERAVEGVDDPAAALAAVRRTLAELKTQSIEVRDRP